MGIKQVLRSTLLAGLLSVLSAMSGGSSFLPAEEAFQLDVDIGDRQVVAHWDVAPGYYLYEERLEITPVTSDTELGPTSIAEEGVLKDDPTFGKQIVHYDSATLSANLGAATGESVMLEVTWQGCTDDGLCYPPQTRTLTLDTPGQSGGESGQPPDTASSDPAASSDTATADGLAGLLRNARWQWVLLTFFALGIGLTFTPCVLPMVPILSGIIVGQSQRPSTGRAFVLSLSYVLSMAFTYALAGAAMGHFGARANIQAWMQQPLVLGLFALVFILLALSMFGIYQLQLPATLRERLNRVGQRRRGGQIASVGAMGVLSALVVSPCVSAPLAGALIYVSMTGDALMGGAALFALALGMGVPLLLIGTLGTRILPRAGKWMDAVKQAFGVMLLAVALWLVQRLLPDSVALGLWALLAIGVGVHLGALQRNTTGWARSAQALGLACLIWGVLLLVGAAQGQGSLARPLPAIHPAPASSDALATDSESFQRTDSIRELQSALDAGQPVMLDFYADWCISCITMEKEIFSQPEVQALRDRIRFLQLDITEFTAEHQRFLDQRRLIGPPAVLFYAADGTELRQARLVGEVGFEGFMSTIEQTLLPAIEDS